jgi:hypothetical protein
MDRFSRSVMAVDDDGVAELSHCFTVRFPELFAGGFPTLLAPV